MSVHLKKKQRQQPRKHFLLTAKMDYDGPNTYGVFDSKKEAAEYIRWRLNDLETKGFSTKPSNHGLEAAEF